MANGAGTWIRSHDGALINVAHVRQFSFAEIGQAGVRQATITAEYEHSESNKVVLVSTDTEAARQAYQTLSQYLTAPGLDFGEAEE